MKCRYVLYIPLFIIFSYAYGMDHTILLDLIKSKIDAGSFQCNRKRDNTFSLIARCPKTLHGQILIYAVQKESIKAIKAFFSYYYQLENMVEELDGIFTTSGIQLDASVTSVLLDMLVHYAKEENGLTLYRDCVNMLKRNKIDLGCNNEKGEPLLPRLVEKNMYTCVEPLLAAGCPTTSKMKKTGEVALHLVRDEKMALLLIEKGNADVNAKDVFGNTPLHAVAARKSINSSNVIKLLVQYKARVNERNNDGCTPLHLARIKYNEQAIETLLKLEADPFATDKDIIAALPIGVVSSMPTKQITDLKDIV